MPVDPDESRFALSTYGRVWDTDPTPDTVTLRQLVTGLMRFELKPDVGSMLVRETRRIERAFATWQRGVHPDGPYGKRIADAVREARRLGTDEPQAAVDARDQLLKDLQGRPKRSFKLWSPVRFRPDGRRESDHVLYLSCLVLDYDSGTSIDEATSRFEPWLHVIHTTWSHKRIHHKFRLILPLQHNVPADRWREFWEWANERTGRVIDQTCKREANTYALPVIKDPAHPHEVRFNPGPLLDPVAMRLIARAAPIASPQPHPVKSHFHGGDPDKNYLQIPVPDLHAEPFDVDGALDDLFR